jgi:flagellar biosynthesis chaperone FliJ
MATIAERLVRMSKQVETAKQELAGLMGRKEEILKQLATKYELPTVVKAEKFIETENLKIKKMKNKLESQFTKLCEKHQWS